MWINKFVELPHSLIRAQRGGRLLVFAGAGVSMGAPADLPSFTELTTRVADGALGKEKNEPEDRFLGRLSDQGVDVDSRTRAIFNNPTSQPTPLHQHVINLFQAPERLRIITTNFDHHFTIAALARFGQGIDLYYAPALPPGRDFRGILYLHGSIDRPRDPLVLTDRDFGRAYLTEGWATRLLVDVHLHFAVLFVGYSHDDTVMRYLARSLPPETERYALTPSGKEDQWRFLGITPISYPLRDDPDPHGALTDAVGAWAFLSSMEALDHDHRIRQIVSEPPPIGREEADYIASALDDIVTLRFFTTHATRPEWLAWADKQEALAALFSTGAAATEREHLLAFWFARHFAFDHPLDALAIARRHLGVWKREFWEEMCRQLWLREPRPSSPVLAAWILALLNSRGTDFPTHFLSSTLLKCTRDEDSVTALILFRFLLTPVARTRDSWRSAVGDPAVPSLRVELAFPGAFNSAKQAWMEIFRPRLASFRRDLVPMLTTIISDAHLLLRAFAGGEDAFDSMSYHRSAIEEHPQNVYPTAADVLIDAARDLITWLLEHDRGDALALGREWSNSPVNLLRRLAVHCTAQDSQVPPDEALAMIRDRGWLYELHMKHEVFRLLKLKYPSASETAREQFIAHSMARPVLASEETDDGSARLVSDYERFNLAVWLVKAAPESVATTKHLAGLQCAHPDFQPREHPDLDHWGGPVRFLAFTSPISEQDMLVRDPQQILTTLLEFRAETVGFDAPRREGLLATVQSAAANSFEWGWKLAMALQAAELWETDLWAAVLRGWRSGSQVDTEWERVLEFLHASPRLDVAFGDAVVEVLQAAVELIGERLTIDALPHIEGVCDRLILGGDLFVDHVASPSRDWLLLAINHTAGRVVLVWLKALAVLRAEAGKDWMGLPVAYRERLEHVFSGTGTWADRARTVLASQVHFLWAADAAWTVAYVIPGFDWDQDDHRAELSWQAFVTWGRWNDETLRLLRPFLERSFARLDSSLDGVRHDFCVRLTEMSLFSAQDPWRHGWLFEFVKTADAKDRENWTGMMQVSLAELSPEAQLLAWNRWVYDYWRQRLTGVPRNLSEGERSAMVGWVLGLVCIFPSAAAMVVAGPAPSHESDLFFFRLRQTDIPARYPAETARLVSHLLAGITAGPVDCEHVDDVVRVMIDHRAPRQELHGICQDMARLGCPTAAELRALIGGRELSD